MTTLIHKRVELLRSFLQERGLNAFIFPSTDPHQGEYIPDHWKTRTWISGFDGSAGTAVVTLDDAALWTDSRYFLAAGEQLKNTPFSLMKERIEGTPSITEWLAQVLPAGSKVGIDPTVNAYGAYLSWKEELKQNQIELVLADDPAKTLWKERPAAPTDIISIQPEEFCGESVACKLNRIRTKMKDNRAEALLLSALDEIAWTLNLRGTDIHCNPVFISYLLITPEQATLFIYGSKLTPNVSAYLKENRIDIREYSDIERFLKEFSGKSIMLDLMNTNCALVEATPASCSIVDRPSPVALMKAIKNEAEIKGFRNAMTRDGVAMVHFLKWLEEEMPQSTITEVSLSNRLEAFRREQSLYKDISFDTIAAYGPHAAIVHYEPTVESDIPLERKGLLLLDSGAPISGRNDRLDPYHRFRAGKRRGNARLYTGAQRPYRTEFGNLPRRNNRHSAGHLCPLCHVAGRHQLSARHGPRRRLLSECARGASSNQNEFCAHSPASRHDCNRRAGYLQGRASRYPYREHPADLCRPGNRVRKIPPLRTAYPLPD